MPTVARLTLSAIAIVGSVNSALINAQSIVARAPTGVTPEAEELLAAKAEPRRLNLLPGDSFMSVARQSCGRLTPTYVRLLQEANKAEAVPKSVAIIPACFVARSNQTVDVRPGETWHGLANRTAGIAGRKTIRDIYASNEGAPTPRGPIMSSASLPIPAGMSKVSVPTTTEGVVYRTKPGVDAEALAAELRSNLDAPPGLVTAPTAIDEFALSAGVDPGLVRKEVCPTPSRLASAAWPFSTSDLAAVLARNATHLAALGSAPTATVVAVVDNGVDGIFSTDFPEDDFDVSVLEKANPTDGKDQDASGYADDIVGTNIYEGGQPVAFASAPMPAHGTMMTSLALGGKEYRDWWSQNRSAPKIRVRAISIVRHSVEASPTGNKHYYKMPTESLGKAIDYATSRGATIFNLSVSTSNQLKPIEDALYNRANLLLIVAAGNDASDLEQGERYPAALSKLDTAYRGRVITVAAHGQTGCLSGFTGRGENDVDLAAPGEGIRATGMGGAEITDEGTSQATALVSFTAAQLRAAGLDQSRAIKERLIASVDLGPQYHGHVRSEGALNVPKALSIFDDFALLASGAGQPIYGKLQTSVDPAAVCPALAGDDRSVLKVSRRVDGGDPSQVRLLLRRNNPRGELKVLYCRPSAQQMSMQALDGSVVTFSWGDVVDLVPRM